MTAEPRYRYRLTCCGSFLYEGESDGHAFKLYDHLMNRPGHTPLLERRTEVIYPYKTIKHPQTGRGEQQ